MPTRPAQWGDMPLPPAHHEVTHLSSANLPCEFPQRLHPASRIFLDAFLEGRMTAAEFQRFFSLPNSDYIPLAECLVRLLGS